MVISNTSNGRDDLLQDQPTATLAHFCCLISISLVYTTRTCYASTKKRGKGLVRTILRRSMTLSMQDKQIVENHMDITYDSLLDEDPEIQERVAKAKIAGQQKAVLDFMEVKFPSLIQVAQEQVIRLNKPDELSRLMKQIALAPDESTARWVLSTFAA